MDQPLIKSKHNQQNTWKPSSFLHIFVKIAILSKRSQISIPFLDIILQSAHGVKIERLKILGDWIELNLLQFKKRDQNKKHEIILIFKVKFSTIMNRQIDEALQFEFCLKNNCLQICFPQVKYDFDKLQYLILNITKD